MIEKIEKLLESIDENSLYHKGLVSIAKKVRLGKKLNFIKINLKELESMTNPDLADKDISIGKVEVDI
jgi:hypothetical protein